MRIRGVCVVAVVLALAALGTSREAHAAEPATAPSQASRSDEQVVAASESLELLVPFYEGLRVRQPHLAFPEVGLSRVQWAYPGPLSAPFVAWRSGGGEWTVLLCGDLAAVPAWLDLSVEDGQLRLRLSSDAATIRRLRVGGSWQDVARAVRAQWPVKGPPVRLADRFDRIDFYVHQWVSLQEDPPLRVDWPEEPLKAAMARTPPRTLVQVYGLDPASVDLGGRVLWSEGAAQKAARIAAANPQVAHLAWLNLRGFKHAIPRLQQAVPVDDAVRAMAKQYDGQPRDDDHWAYRSLVMCLGSAEWQASRIAAFEALADAGVDVVQLDEFPIPPVWHVAACGSDRHLHRRGDAADEWAASLAFIQRLSTRARERGVLLTCEEPSAALLPYVAGYIDRQFNDSIDLYPMRRQSERFEPVPAFSTMFGDLVTPYTDADGAAPARTPPAGWLIMRKVVQD
jgi:hypothetical protein